MKLTTTDVYFSKTKFELITGRFINERPYILYSKARNSLLTAEVAWAPTPGNFKGRWSRTGAYLRASNTVQTLHCHSFTSHPEGQHANFHFTRTKHHQRLSGSNLEPKTPYTNTLRYWATETRNLGTRVGESIRTKNHKVKLFRLFNIGVSSPKATHRCQTV